ncbi:bifunctional diaminohydroxyphosphoribosylaminopyrimidine deaminase/5-amino-6-(5-phosphoribosylamino)uracil reductase RibD [Roseibium sp.]|uniref:bifunctional diaminohydroxyphosphoribosylaminopyrimidine deaminase/5-amino-6-(5-phosphoribosylamino)uracil reductase RibD n=1 Tax=Roseibium sp. TaxID=1936156 RepID=UPI003A980A19
MTYRADDRRFMLAAARFARRGLGRVWPNPSVGALVVRQEGGAKSVVVGRGVTGLPGTGHAEARALAQAGELARGATCYVTLEPCSHFGRTPPCSLALVEAGVGRVVIGIEDPNPRVSGRGITILREAGIEVVVGVGRDVCEDLHAGFVSRISRHRPLVSLKMAVSADGGIGRRGAEPGQEQIHLTGAMTNAHVHAMRAGSDAILIGVGTALADDPSLTCRLPGMKGRSPIRVVLDSKGRLPLISNLVKTAADVPVWLVTTPQSDPNYLEQLIAAGVLVIKVPQDAVGNIDPGVALAALSARGITSVLVEGGAKVAASFEQAGLLDRLHLIRSAKVIGEGRLGPFDEISLESVLNDPSYARHGEGQWGSDRFEIYSRI